MRKVIPLLVAVVIAAAGAFLFFLASGQVPVAGQLTAEERQVQNLLEQELDSIEGLQPGELEELLQGQPLQDSA